MAHPTSTTEVAPPVKWRACTPSKALKVIKIACADGVDDENRDGKNSYRVIVDPGSVMEMAQIIDVLHELPAHTGADPEMVERAGSAAW